MNYVYFSNYDNKRGRKKRKIKVKEERIEDPTDEVTEDPTDESTENLTDEVTEDPTDARSDGGSN